MKTRNHFARFLSALWIAVLLPSLGVGTQPARARQDGAARAAELHPQATIVNTATVFILDSSGSMDNADASGVSKLNAAKDASGKLLDIIEAENRAGGDHEVAIVEFSDSSQVDTPLTTDVSQARSAVGRMFADGGTAMPQGLKTALDLIDRSSTGARPIIILLTDGLPNIGLNGESDESVVRGQVLDLAREAGRDGICIYTVGFGEAYAGTLDEAFLEDVAQASLCGEYHRAEDAWQLANVYIGVRHSSTGTTLFEQDGQIQQGETVNLGTVQIPDNQLTLLFTLNTPDSTVQPILTDPSGVLVDVNYPGASISSTSSLVTVIIQNPPPGTWKLLAEALRVPSGVTVYNAVLSTRPNPNPPAPVSTPAPVTVTDSGFGLVILIVLLAAGAVMVIVLRQTSSLSRARSGGMISGMTPGRLIILTGRRVGQTVPLADRMVIGRGFGSTLRLEDSSASRAHARIRFASGRWFVQDMNSSRGTFVNGYRVQAAALNPGDRIRIGSTELEFRL